MDETTGYSYNERLKALKYFNTDTFGLCGRNWEKQTGVKGYQMPTLSDAYNAASLLVQYSEWLNSITTFCAYYDLARAAANIKYMQDIRSDLLSFTGDTGNGGVCFIAGTLVHAENRLISIENIAVGDRVYSTDTESGKTGLKKVTQTFVRETDQLIHINVDGQTITTTNEHPFYVPTKGWVTADQLHAWDKLVLHSGKAILINSIQYEILKAPVVVYNFEVEDWHTYYVGESGVLVHNTCYQGKPSGGYPDQLIRSQKAGINSEQFEDFLRGIGQDPSKWWKQMESWMDFEGGVYERHYWTNGSQSYFYEDIWYTG